MSNKNQEQRRQKFTAMGQALSAALSGLDNHKGSIEDGFSITVSFEDPESGEWISSNAEGSVDPARYAEITHGE